MMSVYSKDFVVSVVVKNLRTKQNVKNVPKNGGLGNEKNINIGLMLLIKKRNQEKIKYKLVYVIGVARLPQQVA